MKPMPASRMQSAILSGARSILTPSAASTSAAPDFDDNARLPCLATGTPAPATISAAQVEMLNEPEASPPVPTTSMAPGGACTRTILARMAVTAPVISSTVSPRTRSPMRSAPICDGVASPDIICSKASAASSRVNSAPVATLPIKPRNCAVTVSPSINRLIGPRSRPLRRVRRGVRSFLPPSGRRVPGCGEVQKILQHQMAVLGRDALGMELHAMHRQVRMGEAHHHAVVGIGGHGELARHARTLDHQRVIARRLERRIDAAKNAGAVVADLRQLAVPLGRSAHHFPPKSIADRLMAEADAEDRNFCRGLRDQAEADAGLLGRAGAGREHDGIGIGGDNGAARHLVVAMHLDLRPQLTEIVHQVEGEAVIVVDEANHRKNPCFPAPKTPRAAPRPAYALPRLVIGR